MAVGTVKEGDELARAEGNSGGAPPSPHAGSTAGPTQGLKKHIMKVEMPSTVIVEISRISVAHNCSVWPGRELGFKIWRGDTLLIRDIDPSRVISVQC